MSSVPTTRERDYYRNKYEQELFEHVLPFWERYSPDREHGGSFNNLDHDGRVYDTTKHIWLLARQVWMFSKLYRCTSPKPEWLSLAHSGIHFIRRHAVRSDGRVYFALTKDGHPIYQQRKIFTESFYVMALAEYARAADNPALLQEAREGLERIWGWAYDWTQVGRPTFSGVAASQTLAVPMILLNLIDEVAGPDIQPYAAELDDCFRRMRLHVDTDTQKVYENVTPEGKRLAGPSGRLLNPGHAIEAGWFLQHWAQRLHRKDLQELALQMARWSHATGWDTDHGGIYYFLDADGFSPPQLEWSMKLWWPHCEALYAHLLHYSLTGDHADWSAFESVDRYIFDHFVDSDHGEWYGYLNREGCVTHRFKGGPYKGCFHVPRALWLSWRLLNNWPTTPL